MFKEKPEAKRPKCSENNINGYDCQVSIAIPYRLRSEF